MREHSEKINQLQILAEIRIDPNDLARKDASYLI